MNKLHEVLSAIQQRNADIELKRTLSRKGNIARGSGAAPISVASASTRRSTKLKRLGPTARASKTQQHLRRGPGQGATRRAVQAQQRQSLTTGTEMNWKNKLVEALIEMSDKDLYYYKGRPSRKKVKKKGGDRRSKKTKAADDKAAAAEAKAATQALTGGTYTQQRGK